MATAAPTAPALRQVTAEVLTPVGWMNGTFRVPPHQPFLDYLTLGTIGARVINFTRVRVPNEPDPVPFVALSRESVRRPSTPASEARGRSYPSAVPLG